MSLTKFMTRAASGLVAVAAALALAPSASAQTSMAEIEAAANKEGRFVWYDSINADQAGQILAEFRKAYPAITPEFVEVPAAQRIARVTQESLAGGPTADFMTDTLGAGQSLVEQGLLRSIDWAATGMDLSSRRVLNEHFLATHAAIYVQIYNTSKVTGDAAPATYDDLLKPEWANRIGTWNRPTGMVGIAAAWGEEKTSEYAQQFAKVTPRLYRSGAAAAEAVGAGEIDVGAFLPYNTVLPTIRKGAPVEVVLSEPVPVVSLYALLPNKGENPNASLLFLNWLTSADGAAVLEAATGRGNPFIPGTPSATLLGDKKTALALPEEELKQAGTLTDLETRLSQALQGR